MILKILEKVINAISIVIIAAAIFVLLIVVMTKSGEAPNILGYSVFRVMTGSMEPTIHTDSLIVVKRIDPEEVKVDDIITFYSSDPSLAGAVNTHRVIGIDNEGGKISFRTRGDANNADDIYPASSANLIGTMIFQSGALGKFVHLLSNPLIFVPLVLIPFALLIISNLIKTIKLTKTLMKEEEEKAIKEALEKVREKKLAEMEEKDSEEME